MSPRRDSHPSRPGCAIRQVLWLFADGTVLLLLGLLVLAAGPGYEIVSDGIARRWQDEYAIVAHVLRALNLSLALALLAGVFYVVVRVVGFLLGLDGNRIRRVGAGTLRLFRFWVVMGMLELLTWFAQQVLPRELPRALVGVFLMLAGARSLFRFPPRTARDALFLVGLAVAVEGVASLLWDSAWIWQFWGALFATVAAVAAVAMVVLRWWRGWDGGFGSSASVLGETVEEAWSVVQGVRAIGPRYFTTPKATQDSSLGPPDHAPGGARQPPRPDEPQQQEPR